jgi:hypothetical protein
MLSVLPFPGRMDVNPKELNGLCPCDRFAVPAEVQNFCGAELNACACVLTYLCCPSGIFMRSETSSDDHRCSVLHWNWQSFSSKRQNKNLK